MQRVEGRRAVTPFPVYRMMMKEARGAGLLRSPREHVMTFVRRAGTVLVTVLLSVGLIGAGPADAGRDTSWGGARVSSGWGR